MGLALLPLLGAAAHPLHHSLNLPGRDGDAAGLLQVALGLEISRLIRPFQADELGQGRRVADFQSQRVVGWIMALALAGVIIVITSERELAEDPLRPDGFPALAHFSGLGLVGAVNAVGCLLKQPADQGIGRLEDGGAHQRFQLLDGQTVGFPRLEAGHQLLDFLVLGQEEFWRRVFFFDPASLSARVFSTTSCAYCCANAWKRW